jgi:hypothetical protein
MDFGSSFELIAGGGLSSPQQYVFQKGGDVTNTQLTTAQNSRVAAVTHNVSGFGGGGSNGFEAVPGMFARFA